MSDERIELSIERPVAGGRMLARHDGRVVFVSGAIPGERVRARVERATRQVMWAEAVEIVEASPDRNDPPSDPACGGALYSHIAYARQLELKAEVVVDAFRRIGKMTLPRVPAVAASPDRGYRLRARLHVRDGRVGFFREGSHVLCDAAATGQLDRGAVEAVARVSTALGPRLAECDSVIVAENVAATDRVVHLIPRIEHGLDDLRLKLDDVPGLTGVTAASRAGGVLAIAGNPSVTDTAAELFGDDPPIDPGVSWARRAASFFQANRFLVGALVRRVLAASAGETAADLYSGVGLFAVALAARGIRVVAVEGDSLSGADLRTNAAPWPSALRVVSSAVEDFVRTPPAPAPDVVVLDPPRTGASAAVLEGLVRWAPPSIVYVSCDPPTLARDAGRLAAAGYQVTSIESFDLFPNTPHVETVTTLARD